ncbi:MAG TPA: UDP-glucose 4-epimerase GalE [Candidatus Limnocylindrales bacterium]|nr:UDP-glucose 4-epimerase GalE [Candidatus Limnocylindrales bacterium]
MRVLVTGGAGYVGSVTVERLVEAGHETTVLDSLVTGHRAAMADGARLVVGSVADRSALTGLLRERGIEAVLHCAARSLVGESVREPALYYRENVVGGVALLEAMREAGVDRLVFSSTAAVYGEPLSIPITEDSPLKPINPYGETKRAFEGALRWYGEAHGLRAVALRYFNAAGASERFGEDHEPETHLIPNLLEAVMGGPPVTVFGQDYPTPDGTCIRDYIHVLDLAAAHLAALEATAGREPGLLPINLGSGSGFSVQEVLDAAARVIGQEVPHTLGPRRPGDPPILLASNQRAAEVLGWSPSATLDAVLDSAWRWRQAHPEGYPEDPPEGYPNG